jgi:4-aminobutyrate aminotransferase-like enzyme
MKFKSLGCLSSAMKHDYKPLKKGLGIEVWDVDDKKYYDLSSQTLNLAVGHCHPEVVNAIISQANELHFASGRFSHNKMYEFAQTLISYCPKGFDRVHARLCNGTDAVETAIKLARKYTGKDKIAVLPNAWHGESMATLSSSTAFFERKDITVNPGYVFASEKNGENPLSNLINLIYNRNSEIAAALIDPLMISNGMPLGFSELKIGLNNLKEACNANNVVLIFDEIQTFGGWLDGHLFAVDFFDVTPDLIVLAKALGAGLPLAALIFKSKFDGVIMYNEAEFTSGGQPIACAAALAGLSVFEKNRTFVKELGMFLKDNLVLELVKKGIIARNLGLFCIIDLSSTEEAEMVARELYLNGVFIRNSKNKLFIKLAIVTKKEQLGTIIPIILKTFYQKGLFKDE